MSATAVITEVKYFKVLNPATGEEVGKYPLMDKELVDAAVSRARDMFPAWSSTTHKLRRRILKKAAAILAENATHYAEIISKENGKSRVDAMISDISTTCDILGYYAKHAEKFLAPVRVSGSIFLPGRRAYYKFEPKGVIGIISPWNYPFTLSAGPVVTALAAGNTVVLKPSSQTTGAGMILKEILEKAGLFEGVLEVVTGSGSLTGELLINHPGLDMLFFTGSTEVGRKVYLKAAERLIPAIMELGGKNVAIVTRNADITRAAHAVVWGAFHNAGQTCTGVAMALIEWTVYDSFKSEALDIAKNLKLGQGEGEVGSITMADQRGKIEGHVKDAIEKGAKVLLGGERDPNMNGNFFPPTILTDVKPEMKVMREETFGPVLSLIPYDSLDEAMRIANGTQYGLAGSIFTKDMEEAHKIADLMRIGTLSINDTLVPYALPSLPFGGVKDSGVGRYHGRMGIQAFTNIKSITEFNWDVKKDFYHYPMSHGIEEGIGAMLVAIYSDDRRKKLSAMAKSLPIVRTILKRGRE